jgi:hypothetical protein
MTDAGKRLIAAATRARAALRSESEPWPLRCEISGNPCGTDTVQVGYQCQCANCVKWSTPPGYRG